MMPKQVLTFPSNIQWQVAALDNYAPDVARLPTYTAKSIKGPRGIYLGHLPDCFPFRWYFPQEWAPLDACLRMTGAPRALYEELLRVELLDAQERWVDGKTSERAFSLAPDRDGHSTIWVKGEYHMGGVGYSVGQEVGPIIALIDRHAPELLSESIRARVAEVLLARESGPELSAYDPSWLAAP